MASHLSPKCNRPFCLCAGFSQLLDRVCSTVTGLVDNLLADGQGAGNKLSASLSCAAQSDVRQVPLQLSWHAMTDKYLERLEKMDADRMLKQAFIADSSLPARLSWRSLLEAQLENNLVPSPTEDDSQHKTCSLQSAQRQHMEQLDVQTSSKTALYRSIKLSYGCEPYIQQTSNRHLRRIIAQFRTGSHWLNIETGRHKKLERKDRICPMCSHRIINPNLAPEYFDSFENLMMKAVPLLGTMPILTAQAMPMPVSFFLTFSRAISAQSAISQSATIKVRQPPQIPRLKDGKGQPPAIHEFISTLCTRLHIFRGQTPSALRP